MPLSSGQHPHDINTLLNDFAIRSFRDQADADYITARMAYRAGIRTCLWSSQQMIEKYFKCALLLNRIRAPLIGHSLSKGLALLQTSTLEFEITPATQSFIDYIDRYGTDRYLEFSHLYTSRDLIQLDRTAWELRRYCTLDPAPRSIKLQKGEAAPLIHLDGGYLEKILKNSNDPAHKPLKWQNAFFSVRNRRTVTLAITAHMANAPLFLHPEILEEVCNYVYLPKSAIKAYKKHAESSTGGS